MTRTVVYQAEGAGVLLDITNDTAGHIDCSYASLTAPKVVCCEVRIEGRLHDVVYAGNGGSHSWWAQAGGKLLDHNGLDPGQRLTITVTGPAALRIDWVE